MSTPQRHELEALDVDEAAVGDLQRRDHREREERQRLERRAQLAAERRRRVDAARGSPRHLVERRVREQAGDRQRQLGEHAARPRRRRCRRRARRGAATARAMSSSSMPTTTTLCASCATRRGERAALQAEAADEPDGRSGPCRGAARPPRSSRGRAPGRRPRRRPRPRLSTSDSVTIWSGTSPITRDRAARPRDARSPRRATGAMRTVCRTQSGTSRPAISSTGRPRFSTSSGTKRLEVGQHEHVGLVAGRDRAEVASPCHVRRVVRRASRARPPARRRPRPRRAPSQLMCPSSAMCSGLAVVGAERDPVGP